MNNTTDARVAQLLLEDAPPASNARFRIALLQRRERQLYRQRAWRRVIVSIMCVVLPGVALFVLKQPVVTALVAGVAVATVVAGLRVVGAARQAWRWIAASRLSQGLR
jgi:hypothetical protein